MRHSILFLFLAFASLPHFAQSSKKQLSLQEIWGSRTFAPAFVQGGQSMRDGKHYTALEAGDGGSLAIVKYAYASGEKVAVIWNSNDYNIDGKPLEIDAYTFSADETKLLVPTETEPLYRYSSR